jgi:hypothetical protein
MPDSSKIRWVAGYGQRYLSTRLIGLPSRLSQASSSLFFNHLARLATSPGQISGHCTWDFGMYLVPGLTPQWRYP